LSQAAIDSELGGGLQWCCDKTRGINFGLPEESMTFWMQACVRRCVICAVYHVGESGLHVRILTGKAYFKVHISNEEK